MTPCIDPGKKGDSKGYAKKTLPKAISTRRTACNLHRSVYVPRDAEFGGAALAAQQGPNFTDRHGL